jgi:hypothetical protein
MRTPVASVESCSVMALSVARLRSFCAVDLPWADSSVTRTAAGARDVPPVSRSARTTWRVASAEPYPPLPSRSTSRRGQRVMAVSFARKSSAYRCARSTSRVRVRSWPCQRADTSSFNVP